MSYHPFEEIEKMTIETPNDQELGEKVRKFINACNIIRDIAVKYPEGMITSDLINDGLYEV